MSSQDDNRILNRAEFEEAVKYDGPLRHKYRKKLLAHDEALRQQIERQQAFREHLLRRLERTRETISSLASRLVEEMGVASKLIEAVRDAIYSTHSPYDRVVTEEAYDNLLHTLDDVIDREDEDE